MTSTCGIASSHRTFLEMTLENVATREGIGAQNTHVWAVTSVSQHVALEMLRVKISLGAVGTRKFAIGVLLGDGVALWRAIETVLHDGGSSWHLFRSCPSPVSRLTIASIRIIHTRSRWSRS